jgi:hypothetical protein
MVSIKLNLPFNPESFKPLFRLRQIFYIPTSYSASFFDLVSQSTKEHKMNVIKKKFAVGEKQRTIE